MNRCFEPRPDCIPPFRLNDDHEDADAAADEDGVEGDDDDGDDNDDGENEDDGDVLTLAQFPEI